MGLFTSTKMPKGKKTSHRFSTREKMKQMLQDELGADARAAAATGPTAAERHAEEAQYKGRGRARW